MTRRDIFWGVAGGFTVATFFSATLVFLVAIGLIYFEEKSTSEPPAPHADGVEFRQAGLYDFTVLDEGVKVVFSRCRYLGRAQNNSESDDRLASDVAGSMVLEREDGSRVYLISYQILAIAEASPSSQTQPSSEP